MSDESGEQLTLAQLLQWEAIFELVPCSCQPGWLEGPVFLRATDYYDACCHLEVTFPKWGESNAEASLARCLPDIPFKDIRQAAVRRMAYSVPALHAAAHYCDYYIVEYQCKSLEHNAP